MDNYFALAGICDSRGHVVTMFLPFPPTNNTYYRHITLGSRHATLISKRGREYKKTIKNIINGVEVPLYWYSPYCKLTVRRMFYAPDHRQRDIDNYSKVLWDSLKMGRTKKKKKEQTIIEYDDCALFDDDTQIKREYTEWVDKSEWEKDKSKRPGVFVEIWARGPRLTDIRYM